MMNEPLFFEPEPELPITKTAGEVDLPEDPNQWPQEILQELYKQVPYIVDYQPHVEMKRVDAERGYGLGHVEIRNQTEAPMETPEEELEATGIRTVRIPFVIKESKLSPFDLLMNDQSKLVPLTENRLRQSLFRPQAFDVTSRTPGDQSMIGQLYPPYRQNYGFGGGGVSMDASGGMGKMGAKEKDSELVDSSLGLLFDPSRHIKRKAMSGVGTAVGAGTGAILGGAAGGALGDATGLGRIPGLLIGGGLGGLGGGVAGSHLGKLGSAESDLEQYILEAGLTEEEKLAELNKQALMPLAAGIGMGAAGRSMMQPKGPSMGETVGKGLGTAAGAGTGGYLGYRAGKALGQATGLGGGVGGVIGALGGGLLGGAAGHTAGGWAGRGFKGKQQMQPGVLGKAKNWLMGGPAAQKTGSVLDSVLPMLSPEDHDRFLSEVSKVSHYLGTNGRNITEHFSESLGKVVESEPVTMKLASWLYITPPTVVQISKQSDGYMMKLATPMSWAPAEFLIDRGAVVHGFGEKIAMDVDTTGSVTMTEEEAPPKGEAAAEGEEPPVGEEQAEELESIQEPGIYKVKDAMGKELLGFAVPELVDTNGETVPVKMFTNGSVVAIQSDIVGEPAGEGYNLPAAPVGKHGAFYGASADGKMQITVPFEIESSQAVGEDPTTFVGTCFDGRPIKVSVQPNIQVPIGNDDTLLIPDSWQWLPLDAAESVTLLGGEEEQGTEEIVEKEAHLQIRSDGSSFSFSGPPVEKLAYDQKSYIDIDQAMLLMAGLGVHQVRGAEKLAEAITGGRVATVAAKRQLELDDVMRKEADGQRAYLQYIIDHHIKKPGLVKEAATMPDPTTVDTVLSLGFVNPDNIMNFVSYLPDIEDSQSKMCELLFGVRLGLSNVPQSSLERAIRSLEETIEGLKILAFQGS